MNSEATTSARRSRPRTTAGIKCVAGFHAYFALVALAGFVFLLQLPGETQFPFSYGVLVGYGVSVTVLAVVTIGLLRRHRWARWASVFTSLFIATGNPVIGTVIFMYMIRPEVVRHFV